MPVPRCGIRLCQVLVDWLFLANPPEDMQLLAIHGPAVSEDRLNMHELAGNRDRNGAWGLEIHLECRGGGVVNLPGH